MKRQHTIYKFEVCPPTQCRCYDGIFIYSLLGAWKMFVQDIVGQIQRTRSTVILAFRKE